MMSARDRSAVYDEPKAGPWHGLCHRAGTCENPMTKNIIRIGLGGRFVFERVDLRRASGGDGRCADWKHRGGHDAHALSRDVADRLARGTEASTDVIVAAADGAIDQLALRYGATVKRRIRGGAVLEVTGGQLEASVRMPMSRTWPGDVPVQRMGLTAEATGADQVWKGAGGRSRRHRPRHRRRGHRFRHRGARGAARPRVVASVDFPARHVRRRCTTSTATARTSPASSPAAMPTATAAWRRTRSLINLHVLGADGSGKTSDVIDAIDWAVAHRDQFNIRVHQPVARPSGPGVLPRRSAVPGRAARDRRRASSWWRRPATSARWTTAVRSSAASSPRATRRRCSPWAR